MFRKEMKVELFQEFTPRSQYSCTKCIEYIKITKTQDLTIGSHVCFEKDLKYFYHGIISGIQIVNGECVRLSMIHPSRKNELAVVKRLFGEQYQQHDTVVEETLPKVELHATNLYQVRYGDRIVCKPEEVLQRATKHIRQNPKGTTRKSYGTIRYERIPSEPEIMYETSELFASWCVTGEGVSLNARSSRESIEHRKTQTGITMHLKITSDKDPVECATKLHRQRLLCNSCFLSEIVRLVNSTKKPETKYNIRSGGTTWVQDRQTPVGLYRVKYKPMLDVIKIKVQSFNAKNKRRATSILTETFLFTLVPGEKCDVNFVEESYTCNFPFCLC